VEFLAHGVNPQLGGSVTETPPVSLQLPSGSFSDPQTGAPERQARRLTRSDGRARERQARRLLPAPACACVPLDAAATL